MTRNILAVALWCVLSISCGGGHGNSGGDGNSSLSSPTAPSNPQNTNFTGTWAGTLARPQGLDNINVRWAATQTSIQISGPLTMTYNGITLDAAMSGTFYGSTPNNTVTDPSIGPIQITRANATTLPTCQMFVNGFMFKGFTPTSTTLTSEAFTIRYDYCQGFVAPDQFSTSHSETTQMVLTRQ